MELSSAELGKLWEEQVWGDSQELSFRCVLFEMRGDIEEVSGNMIPDFTAQNCSNGTGP